MRSLLSNQLLFMNKCFHGDDWAMSKVFLVGEKILHRTKNAPGQHDAYCQSVFASSLAFMLGHGSSIMRE